jgi:hypothetical protein
MNGIDLHKILLEKERALVASLTGMRAVLDHPGAKGDVSEGEWRAVIDEFLPERYTVSTKTKVIDSFGQASDLIDVVVHDRHFCPLFFDEHGVRLVPAESVFAVVEVKQVLDKAVVDYAQAKTESVRRLHRTNAEIVDRGVLRDPRPEFDIVAAVAALESAWSPPFGDPLTEALRVADPLRRIDLGCALANGAFEVFYAGDGEPHLERAGEGALMFFLLRLFARLQAIGSPMVIDLRAYSKPLEVDPDALDGSQAAAAAGTE